MSPPQGIATFPGIERLLDASICLTHGISPSVATLVIARKPIDELSYMPSGGWSRADVPFFHQVSANFKELAQKSVFRYYRVITPVRVPGYQGSAGNLVSRLEQILPIEEQQVATAVENGQPSSLPAAVFGVWFQETGDMTNSVPALVPAPRPAQGDGGDSLSSVYDRPFMIDTARGLVIFDEPVYRNTHPSATGGAGYELVIGPARLVLRTACHVRDAKTLTPTRYSRTRQTGSSLGAGTRHLDHEEIIRTHLPTYSTSYALEGVATNQADADQVADHYLDAAMREYQTRLPQTMRYAGLRPVELDGAIQQVAFHVGGQGATTTASRHNEMMSVAISYGERRRIEQARDLERERKRTSSQTMARALKANPHIKPRVS